MQNEGEDKGSGVLAFAGLAAFSLQCLAALTTLGSLALGPPAGLQFVPFLLLVLMPALCMFAAVRAWLPWPKAFLAGLVVEIVVLFAFSEIV